MSRDTDKAPSPEAPVKQKAMPAASIITNKGKNCWRVMVFGLIFVLEGSINLG
jgi:hypothetical protein